MTRIANSIRNFATEVSLIACLLGLACLTAAGQTNTPAPPTGITDLGNTIIGYFVSFNTNFDSTFRDSSFDLWTGVSSVQNGDAPIVNDLGLSYDVWRPAPSTNSPVSTALSLENVIRDSGVAGSLISDQFGLGVSIKVHDVKLTGYLDGGYDFFEEGARTRDRIYGEVGLRAKKAISSHFYLGVGIGAQFPRNSRVFSAFTGATW